MSAQRRLILWLLLLAGSFLVAVGVIRLIGPPRTEGPPPSAPAGQPLPRAPDIEIRMYQGAEAVGGNVVRLSQVWARGKPVVVNFFAGLCPPCRAEMPDLQRLADQAGDRFVLISIDVGPYTGLGTREEGQALLRTLGIRYPAGTVFDEDITDTYQILGMPTTVFITADGRILRKHAGLLTFEQMQTFAEELIRFSPPPSR
ncbi:MAG TPA: TlpA disulfide reductase family protein [bacterium]|jgi:thiol-disulfide isomerase/thioredoxin|nr:TlpA disulfide reductase family protein [bacterium]